MREKYESLSVAVLRDLCKARGILHVSGFRKGQLIDAMLAKDEEEKNAALKEEKSASLKKENENRKSAERRRPDQRRGKNADSRAQAQPDETQLQRRDSRAQAQPDETQPQRRDSRAQAQPEEAQPQRRDNRAQAQPEETQPQRQESRVQAQPEETQPQRQDNRGPARQDRPPADLASLDSGNVVTGILEVLVDGYGFLRSDNYLPGENDVYVAPSQIRKFNLKTGDMVSGNVRVRGQGEKYCALLYLTAINGYPPSVAAKRMNFEDMTPVFPNHRLRMEREGKDIAMRIVDLISPVGRGQRGMIVSQPKAGKTTLLKEIAKSILRNEPEMHIMIMLIDERPEEVTDIREAITGERVEVLYSTFDELPEHHKRVSEMGIERAKRLVEHGENVTILLDSITRLARAYNLTVSPSGRTLSGGLDPAALYMPKRFFGAARNMREGGSLTILATALVDTGSKMDDVVYEEFKGTGNMELVLDRKLSERRVFPAIDIQKSGTRREDLLLDRPEYEAAYIMRKALNGMKSEEAVENILNMFVHTRDNAELVSRIRRQRFI